MTVNPDSNIPQTTGAAQRPDWYIVGPGLLYCRECFEPEMWEGNCSPVPPDQEVEDDEPRCHACGRKPCGTCGLRIVDPPDEIGQPDECGHCLLATYVANGMAVAYLQYLDDVAAAERWLTRAEAITEATYWPSPMRRAYLAEFERYADAAARGARIIGRHVADGSSKQGEIAAELVRTTAAGKTVMGRVSDYLRAKVQR